MGTSMRIERLYFYLAASMLLLAFPVRGQEGPVTFEFSFSNPGARAMGLGGAFAALADDATAAFANPAGLVQLLEPEAPGLGKDVLMAQRDPLRELTRKLLPSRHPTLVHVQTPLS